MIVITTDTTNTNGLTADEEAQLACECLRLGSWPREVVIARTGTRYVIDNRQQGQRLLRLLGVRSGHEEAT